MGGFRFVAVKPRKRIISKIALMRTVLENTGEISKMYSICGYEDRLTSAGQRWS